MSELDTQINRSQLVKQELEKLFVVKRSTDQENNLLRKCDGPTKSKSFSASSTHQSAGVCSLRSTTPPVVPPRPSPETMNLVNAEFNLIRNSNQVKVEETGEVQHRSTAKPPVPKKPANLARSAQLSNLDTSCTSSTESFVTATGSEWPDSSSNSVVSNSEKSLENSFDEEEKTPVVDVKDFPAGPIYEPLGGNEPNSPYPTVNKSGVFDTLNKFPWKRKNAKKVTRSKTLGNMGSLDSGGESDRPSSELAETDDTCNSPGKSVFYMTKEDRSLSNDSSEVSLQRGQLRQTFSAGQSAPSVVSATSNQSGTFKYPPPGDFFYRVSRQQKKKTTRTAASLEVPSSCLDRLNLTEGGGAVLRNKTRRSSRGKPKGRRPSAPVLTRSLSDSYVRRKSYRQMTSDISERPWSSKNSGAKRTSSYESSLYRDSSGYNSGLHESSSEESEMEEAGSENGVLEVKTAVERKRKKLKMAAEEFLSTEKTYLENLTLLVEEFPKHINRCSSVLRRPVTDEKPVGEIHRSLSPLLQLHKNICSDFQSCIDNWDPASNVDQMEQTISDVLVKKGAYVKMASEYVKQKNSIVEQITNAAKKYPDFEAAILEFEKDHCNRLKFISFFDCVHQRVCRYPLLISHYRTYLQKDSQEYRQSENALQVMTQVAITVEQSLSDGDNAKRLCEIQRKVFGQYEIIAPGRQLLKEGELLKFSRKEQQPRLLFLFSDQLVIGIPVPAGQFRIRSVIPLLMIAKVESPSHSELKKQFLIYSQQRSFTMIAKSAHESSEWVKAIQAAVNNLKFVIKVKADLTHGEIPEFKAPDSPASPNESRLGKVAPCWVPDSNVTMCQHCSVQFNLFVRRHHCRACGKIVCADCCGKAPLEYSNFESQRVCPTCYSILLSQIDEMPSHGGIAESKTHADPYKGSPPSRQALLDRFKPPSISHCVRDRSSSQQHLHSSSNGLFKKRTARIHTDESELMSGSLDVKFPEKQTWKRCWVRLMPSSLLEIYLAKDDTKVERKIVLLSCDVIETHPDDRDFVGTEFQVVHRNQISLGKDSLGTSFVYVFRAESVATGVSWLSQIKEASQLN